LKETLSRISLRDDNFISSLQRADAPATDTDLDHATCALVRLAAVIGLDGSSVS
jgi:hypothetical protein